MATPSSSETETAPEGEPKRRARQRLRPRASLASGEAEFCARGAVCFSVVLGVPLAGWQATCAYSGTSVIMLLRPDATVFLLPLCSCAG